MKKNYFFFLMILGLALALALIEPNPATATQLIQGGGVSGSVGDPADMYLEFSLSGADFVEPRASFYEGVFTGGEIKLSGKAIVSRGGEGSWVILNANVGDQSIHYPPEGSDGFLQDGTFEYPFTLSFTVPPDYPVNYVQGGVSLEVCGASFCAPITIGFQANIPGNAPPEPDKPNLPEKIKCTGRDSGARFSDFYGEVLISACDDRDDERPAERDMVLVEGEHIRTGGDSMAIISYGDGSTFIMKSRSHVVLGNAPEKKSKLSLVAGQIWVNVKKMITDGTLDVTMNQAIAGTKGTTFVLEDDGQVSTLKVFEGTLSFTSLANGKSVDVHAGESISADRQGLSEILAIDIASEMADWPEVYQEPGDQEQQTHPEPVQTNRTMITLLVVAATAGGLLIAGVVVILIIATGILKRAPTVAKRDNIFASANNLRVQAVDHPQRTSQPAVPRQPSKDTRFPIWIVAVVLALTGIVCLGMILVSLYFIPQLIKLPDNVSQAVATSTMDITPLAQGAARTATQQPIDSNPQSPTMTPLTTPGFSCPGAPASRLQVGSQAAVGDVGGYSLTIFAEPGDEFAELFYLEEGDLLKIINGPICSKNQLWWEIQRDSGHTGWAPESSETGDYLLNP